LDGSSRKDLLPQRLLHKTTKHDPMFANIPGESQSESFVSRIHPSSGAIPKNLGKGKYHPDHDSMTIAQIPQTSTKLEKLQSQHVMTASSQLARVESSKTTPGEENSIYSSLRISVAPSMIMSCPDFSSDDLFDLLDMTPDHGNKAMLNEPQAATAGNNIIGTDKHQIDSLVTSTKIPVRQCITISNLWIPTKPRSFHRPDTHQSSYYR